MLASKLGIQHRYHGRAARSLRGDAAASRSISRAPYATEVPCGLLPGLDAAAALEVELAVELAWVSFLEEEALAA